MKNLLNRRSFVKETLISSTGLALALQAEGQEKTAANVPATRHEQVSAKGKIGKLSVSRLILGGNLLPHYTHSRDLKYV